MKFKPGDLVQRRKSYGDDLCIQLKSRSYHQFVGTAAYTLPMVETIGDLVAGEVAMVISTIEPTSGSGCLGDDVLLLAPTCLGWEWDPKTLMRCRRRR